ncbi:hypothetical protein H5410_064311 [Solanum commersonii]|uniref:Reverse transcriptase zinc-binding domain-containing protein n=1 Tax=Solanum commersonii TaxID=4109 RepID=A0A9J5VZP2_SOLCO|nr:hypothetical protein H5410_064311 [Solanum commersonii]
MDRIDTSGDSSIYYNAGFKSYEITKCHSGAESWYEWCERMRNLMRRVKISHILEKCEKRLTNWKCIDALRRQFLCQGSEDNRKFHSVKWEFANEDDMLWKDVITAKYGMEEKWTTTQCIEGHQESMTMDTSKNQSEGEKWLEDLLLGRQLIWTRQGWNLGLRRQLNDWEIENVTELLSHLAVHTSLTKENDVLLWQEDIKGDFSVKSAISPLTGQGDGTGEILAMEDDMEAKEPQERLSVGPRFYLCGEQAEPANHLFLHCKWIEQLWRMFTSLKGIVWVKPGCIGGVIGTMNGNGNVTKEERWKIVSACIWWSIWKERNNRSFENVQKS